MTGTRCVCNGSNGANALVKATAEAAGTNCASGGTRLDVGLDANKNNALDASEIAATTCACNGAKGTDGTNGLDGKNALISTTTEAAGSNCANDGIRIDVGAEANANGTLEASESAANASELDEELGYPA